MIRPPDVTSRHDAGRSLYGRSRARLPTGPASWPTRRGTSPIMVLMARSGRWLLPTSWPAWRAYNVCLPDTCRGYRVDAPGQSQMSSSSAGLFHPGSIGRVSEAETCSEQPGRGKRILLSSPYSIALGGTGSDEVYDLIGFSSAAGLDTLACRHAAACLGALSGG